jgi:hypothetical protein
MARTILTCLGLGLATAAAAGATAGVSGMMRLAARRNDADLAETALRQIATASGAMRDGGHLAGAAYFEALIPKTRAELARLRGG